MDYIVDKINELNYEFKTLKNEYAKKTNESISIYQDLFTITDENEKQDWMVAYEALEEKCVLLIEEMKKIMEEEQEILQDASVFVQLTLPVAKYDDKRGYTIGTNSVKIKELSKSQEFEENIDFQSKLEKTLSEDDELELEDVEVEGHWLDDYFICDFIKCFKNKSDYITVDFNNGFVNIFKEIDNKSDKYTNLDLMVNNDDYER